MARVQFQIRLLRDKDRVRASTTCLSGEHDTTCDWGTIRRVAKTFRGLVLSGGQTDSRLAGELGRALFDQILGDEGRRILHAAQSVTHKADETLAVCLNLPPAGEGDAAGLESVPWELLHDGEQFLALWPGVTLVRHIRLAAPFRATQHISAAPLRVLLTSASPSDRPVVSSTQELASIQAAVWPRRCFDPGPIQHQVSPTRLKHLFAIQAAVSGWDIWHHIGHGELMVGQGLPTYGLSLVRRDSTSVGLSVAALVSHLEQLDCPLPRLVFLNTCHSGETDSFAGALARINVPVVIGNQAAIPDSAALRFAQAFYASYASNRDPALATSAGRLAASASGYWTDWVNPVVYVRTPPPLA